MSNIKYQEVNLEDIIDYYEKDFDKSNVISSEYFVDFLKRKVIFKFYINNDK